MYAIRSYYGLNHASFVSFTVTEEAQHMMAEKIQVELPTDDYYEAEVKCRNSCPVKTDSYNFV